TGMGSGFAGLAFASQPYDVAGVDACGHADFDFARDLDHAVSPAFRARAGYDFALAAAAGASLLQAEEALGEEDGTMSVSATTGDRLRAGLGPTAGTVRTGLVAPDREIAFQALVRFDQVEGDLDLDVPAAAWSTTAAASTAAKEIAQHIAEKIEDG